MNENMFKKVILKIFIKMLFRNFVYVHYKDINYYFYLSSVDSYRSPRCRRGARR